MRKTWQRKQVHSLQRFCSVLLFALQLAAVCGLDAWLVRTATGHGRQDRVVVHPTPANIPKVYDSRMILSEQVHADTFWFAKLAPNDPRVIRIETSSHRTPINRLISYPVELHLGAENRLFVLAELGIVELDYDLNLIDYFGFVEDYSRPGWVGFKRFASLSVTHEGHTVVATDDSPPLVYVYRRGADGIRLSSTLTVERGTRSACAIGEHLFVLNYQSGKEHVIHKYTLDGKYVRSFGNSYHADEEYVRARLSGSGRIICSDAAEVVVWVSEYSPVIHGFSANGALLWRVLLANYVVEPRVARTLPNGRRRLDRPHFPLGYSRIRHMFTDRAGMFYIAYTTRASREASNVRSHLFAIDAASGSGAYTGARQSFAAVDRNRAFEIPARR